MSASITLTFSGIPSVDDFVEISPSLGGQQVRETFKTLRQANGQVTIGNTIFETIQNFQNAFQTDYGADFNINVISGQSGSSLSIIFFDGDCTTINETISSSVITATTDCNTPTPSIEISNIQFLEADSDPCNNYKVSGDTNVEIDEIIVSYQNTQQTFTQFAGTQSFEFDLSRNVQFFSIKATSNQANPTEFTTTQQTGVSFWIVNTEQVQSINGVTLNLNTIANPSTQPLNLEYSLDGVNYSQNNSFTGLTTGIYNYYVRDAYGCEKTGTVQVDNVLEGSAPPFIDVSELNPVYFAKRNNLPNNNDNTLSYEGDHENNYLNYKWKFPVGQNLRFQYKSSYKFNDVKIFGDGDNITDINPTKLTNNINFLDVRDGYVFEDNGQLAVSYQGGNIYDEQGNVIGTNELFGNLLYDQNEGDLVNVEGFGWLVIDSIEFDSVNGTYMRLNYNVNGFTAITAKIKFLYNVENFEIYEFNLDATNLEQFDCVQLRIDANNGDSSNDEPQYLSELMQFTNEAQEYHVIKWWNTRNNEIAWQTGIEGLIYVPKVCQPILEPKGESDIYMSDTETVLLEGEADQQYRFYIDPIPENLVKQLSKLTSNDMLEIDGISYVKEQEIETEPLIGSNLYKVEMLLTKTTGFNSNSGTGFNIADTSGLLFSNNDGFVRI